MAETLPVGTDLDYCYITPPGGARTLLKNVVSGGTNTPAFTNLSLSGSLTVAGVSLFDSDIIVNFNTTAAAAQGAGIAFAAIGTDGSIVSVSLQTFLNSTAVQPELDFRASEGTAASPTAVANTDTIGLISFRPYSGSSYVKAAQIYATAVGTTSSSNRGGQLVFQSCPSNSTVLATGLTLAGSIATTTSLATTDMSVSTQVIEGVTTAITASTTHSVAGATALTTPSNIIGTVGTVNDAVKLPLAGAANIGQVVFVMNNGASACGVWPGETTTAIDSAGTNTAVTLTNGHNATFIQNTGSTWVSSGSVGHST